MQSANKRIRNVPERKEKKKLLIKYLNGKLNYFFFRSAILFQTETISFTFT